MEGHGTRAPKSNLFSSGFTRGREATPSSIIMGRQVGLDALAVHHSSFGRAFGGGDPVRIRLGGTMGGKFPLGSTASMGGRPTITDRSHGEPGAASTRGPQILSRSSNSGFSRAGGWIRLSKRR